MKIIFHIGMPKTGTTSLQFFLSKNKKALLSQGIVYEPEIFHKQYRSLLPWDTVDHIPGSHHAFAYGFLHHPHEVARLLQERISVYRNYHYYLISSEIMSIYFTTGHIKYLYKYLRGNDIDVVIYLRRQDDILDSMYKQNIESSFRVTPQCMLKSVNVSYSDILSRWQIDKKASIHALKYTPSRTIQNFMDIYDIKLDTSSALYMNITQSRNRTELVARILQNIDIKFSSTETLNFMKDLDDDDIPQTSSRVYSLPERRAIMARYEESNEAVSRQFFDGKPLFDPLPETEPNATPYPSLTLDDALKMLKRHIFYSMRSSIPVHTLMQYIKQHGDFDEDFYRKEYLRGRPELYMPLEHFVRFGMYTGFRPNADFDAQKIYHTHPELRQTGIPPYIIYIISKALKL